MPQAEAGISTAVPRAVREVADRALLHQQRTTIRDVMRVYDFVLATAELSTSGDQTAESLGDIGDDLWRRMVAMPIRSHQDAIWKLDLFLTEFRRRRGAMTPHDDRLIDDVLAFLRGAS